MSAGGPTPSHADADAPSGVVHSARFDRHGVAHAVPVDVASLTAELRHVRHRRQSFLWIEAWAPDRAEMARLAALLGLDARSASEAAIGGQLPKIQSFERHLTIVGWTLEFRPTRPRVAVGEVFLYVMRNALLVVRRPRTPEARPNGSALAEPDATIEGGALGAAFMLLGELCDTYIELTDRIEDELEDIELEVYDQTVVESRGRIYELRQQIGKIGRAVDSLARALESSRENLRTVSVGGNDVAPYVRDLIDRLGSTATLLRDQSSTLDAVVSSHENNVSSRQNEDTRRISSIAALLSVPALLAGIFGMNFANLPLVHNAAGWVIVFGFALLVDVVAGVFLHRRGWI